MGGALRFVPLAATATALLMLFPTQAAPADPPGAMEPVQPAVWTPRQMRFVYSGFTTKYSCDGLRDKMRTVLLKLGARKEDLDVNTSGCPGLSEPTTFPTVDIRMNVLQPAPAPPPGGNAPPAVPAHWQPVDLTHYHDPLRAAGDCELIEQIHQRILPLFTTRNVVFRSNCVPNQLQLGTVLKAEVLMPNKPPPGAAPVPGTQNPGGQ